MVDRIAFFKLEKTVNELIDQFLTYFFISYTNYKDEILDNQRKLVENLSVPIIPINSKTCILPLIGNIDEQRIHTVKSKVLDEIENQHIQMLIMDLSGVAYMEQEAINVLVMILEGISMMGCNTTITGLRAEIVKSLISSGMGINDKAEFKGTLQLALNDVVFQSIE